MTKSTIDRTVSALQSGRLRLRDVLRAACRGNPRLAAWLSVQTQRMDYPKPRQRTPAGAARTEARVAAAVRYARRRFAKVPGVRSVHWGLRRRDGALTPQAGVVVVVERKGALNSIPAPQRLPGSLTFRHAGRTCRVAVDVQPLGAHGELQNGFQPGDNERVVAATTQGTLSGLVTHQGESRALLSGHVAGAVGAKVRGGHDSQVDLGQVQKVVATSDVAAAGPVDAVAAAALVEPLATVRDPDSSDLNTFVRVDVAWDLSGRRVVLTDLDATGHFESGVLQGLVGLETQVTHPGDSGAPVRDFRGDVLGFVVGVAQGKTVLMPARRAIDALLK